MAMLEREDAAEARAARATGGAGARQRTRRTAGAGGGAAPPSVRLLHPNVSATTWDQLHEICV